jgi:hypothetical protein
VKVTVGNPNPYLQRWHTYHQYLRDHPARFVWCTDGTDITMDNSPWEHMKPGVLYVGYEPKIVGIPWMRENHPTYRQWIDDNADLQLLNCGVVGGDHKTVLDFTHAMMREINAHNGDVGLGEMASFNCVCHSDEWRDKIVWGSTVTTLFKHNEHNDFSWFSHK